MTNELIDRLKKLKILVADVDGVFTDGSLFIGENGMEFKRFHVFDGAGVALLRAVKFPLAIISGRHSGVTAYRMKELHLEENLFQGNLAKLEPYAEIKKKFQVSDDEVAYIGDDLIDIPILKRVGVPISVANALPEVKKCAIYVTQRNGGDGALREAIELILKAQEKFVPALEILTKDTYKDI
ncbi:MAG: HAD hydrolase family protein [Candidatus Neomarinimicrobiota bacterium]